MKSALDHGERARGDWIIADIGGTNARFTLWSPSSGVSSDAAVSYRNDDFSDLPSLIDAYQRAVGPGPARALLALALPMTDGQMQMTNRPWTFTARELQQTLGLSTLSLVNDFVAAAAGIGGLAVSELMQIGGERPGAGPSLILGPGTGLGAAAIVGEAGAEIVLASEAGHMGAAPSREDARLVMETARSRHGRASWERLLCGNGLAAFDAIARSLCLESLADGSDRELRPIERVFLYLPFEHSESLADQDRAVELFRTLAAEVAAGIRPAFEEYLDYALRHRAIVERFGRFPHRNAILARQSTAAEIAFLEEPGSSF